MATLFRKSLSIYTKSSLLTNQTKSVNNFLANLENSILAHKYPSANSRCCRCMSTQNETIMNVFDRKTKRMQKNRTALMPDYKVYDYVKDEVGACIYLHEDKISEHEISDICIIIYRSRKLSISDDYLCHF